MGQHLHHPRVAGFAAGSFPVFSLEPGRGLVVRDRFDGRLASGSTPVFPRVSLICPVPRWAALHYPEPYQAVLSNSVSYRAGSAHSVPPLPFRAVTSWPSRALLLQAVPCKAVPFCTVPCRFDLCHSVWDLSVPCRSKQSRGIPRHAVRFRVIPLRAGPRYPAMMAWCPLLAVCSMSALIEGHAVKMEPRWCAVDHPAPPPPSHTDSTRHVSARRGAQTEEKNGSKVRRLATVMRKIRSNCRHKDKIIVACLLSCLL